MTILIWQNQATLQISKITEDNGFVEIRTGEEEIVNGTNTLLHIVNIKEVENILNNMGENIENLDIQSIQILRNEI